MSTKRVALAKQGERSITVEDGATAGAILGVNLRWPTGELVRVEDLQGSPPETPGLSVTYWRMLREIPPNVVALAETITTGLYVITGDGESETRSIEVEAGELTVASADGVAGNPLLGLADVADNNAGALLGIQRDAKGRVTGTVDATITGTAGEIEVQSGDAAAGPPTISLADVADAGGGSLQRTAFDAKGRKIGTSAATTDDLTEGSTNLYFTAQRVRSTLLTGLSLASATVIAATDTVLSALGKLQAQVTALAGSVSGLIVQTITNGDTTHAPSGDAVFDALALKFDKAGGEISGPSSIGTPTAALGYTPAFQIEPNGSSLSAVALVRYGGPGFLAGVRADGVKGAPSAVGTGQGLFELRATGYNGAGFAASQAAAITLLSAEPFTPTANGTGFGLRLCKVGETASALRFRVDGDGTTYPAVSGEPDLGKGGNRWKDVHINGVYYCGGLQVVGARNTGWSAPTGTATKTAFDTATVTTAQLAERVKALTDALIAHGLIGT